MGNRLGPQRLFQQFVVMWLLLLPGFGFARPPQEPMADGDQSLTNIPEWVSRGSYQDGDSFVLVVQTSQQPCITPVAADLALDPAIEAAIRKHLSSLVGAAAAKKIHVSAETINTKLLVPGTRIVRKYQEDLTKELAQRYGQEQAVFYRGYAQIRLDQPFIETAMQQAAEIRMRYRLVLAGLCGAGLLGLLAVLFGYLQINHATRGFYDRRLQTVSLLIVIAIISVIFFAYRTLV